MKRFVRVRPTKATGTTSDRYRWAANRMQRALDGLVAVESNILDVKELSEFSSLVSPSLSQLKKLASALVKAKRSIKDKAV